MREALLPGSMEATVSLRPGSPANCTPKRHSISAKSDHSGWLKEERRWADLDAERALLPDLRQQLQVRAGLSARLPLPTNAPTHKLSADTRTEGWFLTVHSCATTVFSIVAPSDGRL